jgi:hypothetical protein
MDPNRNKLETYLGLPTHRLLSVYKKVRARVFPRYSWEDWVSTCDCGCCKAMRDENEPHEQLAKRLKAELDTRGHVERSRPKRSVR